MRAGLLTAPRVWRRQRDDIFTHGLATLLKGIQLSTTQFKILLTL
jgi:hypothetical protein